MPEVGRIEAASKEGDAAAGCRDPERFLRAFAHG
jgi:hypothetical protein